MLTAQRSRPNTLKNLLPDSYSLKPVTALLRNSLIGFGIALVSAPMTAIAQEDIQQTQSDNTEQLGKTSVTSADEKDDKSIALEALSITGKSPEIFKSTSMVGFTERSIQDTPRSVRVISSEMLENNLVTDLEALGKFDASVTSSYRTPGFQARTEIRGFDVADGQNYRYNGLPFLRQQLTPLENKEQIEILKGLSAFEAGFTSPGGIINFQTKRPTSDPITDLNFGFDQYGSALTHLDVSRKVADGVLGLRFNAAVEELRSYVDEAKGEREFVSLAVDLDITDKLIIEFDAEHQHRDQVLQPSIRPNVNGKIPRGFNPRTFIGQKWANYETDNTTVNSRIKYRFAEQWTAVLEGNWNKTDHPFNEASVSNIQENGDATVNAFISRGTQRKATTVRPMIQGSFTTGDIGHELALGYSVQKTDANFGASFFGNIGNTNIFNPTPLADPMPVIGSSKAGFTIEDSGWFLQDVISLSEAWQIHLGGRYATIDQRSQDVFGEDTTQYEKTDFTPNAAIVFKPTSNLTTYISYVEGLENGGVAPQTNGGQPVTNAGEVQPPLVSEQWEVGVKGFFAQKLSGEVSLFRIQRPSNFINANNTFVQEGNQINQGAEFNLTGYLSESWTLYGSLLLLDAELKDTGDPNTEGNRPTSVPKRRTAVTLEYAPQALPGWVFSGNWTYTSDRPLNNANTFEFAPSFDVFSLNFRYDKQISNGNDPLLKAISIRGGINNIFDERYFSTSNFGQLIAGAPRNVAVDIELKF